LVGYLEKFSLWTHRETASGFIVDVEKMTYDKQFRTPMVIRMMAYCIYVRVVILYYCMGV
jgi:hypothetical protein